MPIHVKAHRRGKSVVKAYARKDRRRRLKRLVEYYGVKAAIASPGSASGKTLSRLRDKALKLFSENEKRALINWRF